MPKSQKNLQEHQQALSAYHSRLLTNLMLYIISFHANYIQDFSPEDDIQISITKIKAALNNLTYKMNDEEGGNFLYNASLFFSASEDLTEFLHSPATKDLLKLLDLFVAKVLVDTQTLQDLITMRKKLSKAYVHLAQKIALATENGESVILVEQIALLNERVKKHKNQWHEVLAKFRSSRKRASQTLAAFNDNLRTIIERKKIISLINNMELDLKLRSEELQEKEAFYPRKVKMHLRLPKREDIAEFLEKLSLEEDAKLQELRLLEALEQKETADEILNLSADRYLRIEQLYQRSEEKLAILQQLFNTYYAEERLPFNISSVQEKIQRSIEMQQEFSTAFLRKLNFYRSRNQLVITLDKLMAIFASNFYIEYGDLWFSLSRDLLSTDELEKLHRLEKRPNSLDFKDDLKRYLSELAEQKFMQYKRLVEQLMQDVESHCNTYQVNEKTEQELTNEAKNLFLQIKNTFVTNRLIEPQLADHSLNQSRLLPETLTSLMDTMYINTEGDSEELNNRHYADFVAALNSVDALLHYISNPDNAVFAEALPTEFSAVKTMLRSLTHEHKQVLQLEKHTQALSQKTKAASNVGNQDAATVIMPQPIVAAEVVNNTSLPIHEQTVMQQPADEDAQQQEVSSLNVDTGDNTDIVTESTDHETASSVNQPESIGFFAMYSHYANATTISYREVHRNASDIVTANDLNSLEDGHSEPIAAIESNIVQTRSQGIDTHLAGAKYKKLLYDLLSVKLAFKQKILNSHLDDSWIHFHEFELQFKKICDNYRTIRLNYPLQATNTDLHLLFMNRKDATQEYLVKTKDLLLRKGIDYTIAKLAGFDKSKLPWVDNLANAFNRIKGDLNSPQKRFNHRNNIGLHLDIIQSECLQVIKDACKQIWFVHAKRLLIKLCKFIGKTDAEMPASLQRLEKLDSLKNDLLPVVHKPKCHR